SKLTNLTYGDRDSQGLFQQRPSTGWGSYSQITDPVAATLAFFGRAPHTQNSGLLDVPGWQRMSVGQAAQAVQASADPTGAWYAQHEMMARRLVAQLSDTGRSRIPAMAPAAASGSERNSGAGMPGLRSAPSRQFNIATLNVLGHAHTRSGRRARMGPGPS
ncbi:MAG: hypothetical protein ACRD0P_33565, partial [Stackebrandtia sp.]